MSTIAYSCPFLPAEWIAAHGFAPSRILPRACGHGSLAEGLGEGVCGYVQALTGDLIAREDTAAIVLTTTCDQMRRAAEVLAAQARAPLFLLHVPTTWETPAAQRLYLEELQRLGRFLERLGGTAPDAAQLARTMQAFDARRAELRDARGRLPGRRFSEAIARFHRDPGFDPATLDGEALERGFPVGLIGGPLIAELLELFELIARGGGSVVLDGTTTGERTLPAPFDRRELRHDPLGVLADAYFGMIPDAFRRPNNALYIWIAAMVTEREVRGLIFLRHTWCDTWAAEAQRLKEWCAVPVLIVDVAASGIVDGRMLSRIQSFLEMLQ